MADEPIDFSEEENNRQREEERTVRDGLIKSLQSELAAINEDVAERIKKRKDLEKLHGETESEIKVVQERIKLLGEAVTDEERRQKEKLESRLSQLTNQEKAQRERIEEQKKSDGLEERIADRDLLARQLNEMGGTPFPDPEAGTADGPNYSELRQNAREVSKAWARHVSVISGLKSPFLRMVAEVIRTQKVYKANRLANEQLLKELQDEIRDLQGKENLSDKEKSELQKKQGKAEQLATDMKVASTMRWISITNQVANYMIQLGKAITQFVDTIRKTQREFAITAADAGKLNFDNMLQSIRSFASTIETFGKTVPVTREELQQAQLDFQEQFGMILDPKEAGVFAERAKELGLTSQQLAESRRVFLTQAMGDVSQIKGLEDQFRTGFEDVLGPGGAKAAFEFIGKNSELMARSGTRFQQSLIKAAAEAKKIGIELSKVNQIGDNIIGDFEGFLDGMAELGAMGFGFDTFRLAQIAETGDTGALFDELRSQLAMTGKDITNLRRSEQLALSRTFGMSIEEFQRMAGGDFEKPIDPIDLQQEANGILTTIVDKLTEMIKDNSVYKWLVDNGSRIVNLLNGLGPTIVAATAAAKWAVQLGFLFSIWMNTRKMAADTTAIATALSGGGLLGGGGVTGPGGAPIPSPGSTGTPGGAAGRPGTLERFFGNVKPSQLLAAGGALMMFAGAMFIMAKAFQEFSKDVTVGGVGAATAAMASLGAAAFGLSKIDKDIMRSAFSLGIISAAVFVTAKAFQEFSGIDWKGVYAGILALSALGLVAAAMGYGIAFIATGAAAITVLSASLWIFGKALEAVSGPFATFGNTIKEMDGINFLGIAGGIYAITAAMAGLAVGGFTKNITDFISGGDPLKKLNDRLVVLSKNTDGVNAFSNSINNLVTSLTSLSEVVERLDINKLNTIVPHSIPEKITSGIAGFTRSVFGISSSTTPTVAVTNDVPSTGSAGNVTGTLVSGTTSNSNITNMEINELKQKLDDVIKTINNLNQLPRALAETIGSMEVNMDGIKVGQVLSTSEGRALTDAVFRAQRL